MELVLNDERRLLLESAEKLVAQIGGPDAHRALRDSDHGFDSARQKEVAEAGWISLMVPERDGGLGLAHLLKEAGLVTSTSEAFRMIKQGAVRIDGERVEDQGMNVDAGTAHVYQVGKRKFARVLVD